MSMCRRLAGMVCALIWSFLAMAPSRAEILPSYVHYGKWFIACDNGLRCEAKGMTDKRHDPHLSVRREAGPEGSMHITVAAPFRFEPSDLGMDGMKINIVDTVHIEQHNSRTLMKISDSVAARAFIQQIRHGNFLEFRDRSNRIPLAGLTAALLRMDERQQRLGTHTALIRRGKAAANRVPRRPVLPYIGTGQPAPGLSPEEEQALLESVQDFHASPLDNYCYGAMHLMTPVRARIWPIDKRHALVAVPCTLTNIQQVQSFVYIAERSQGGTIVRFQSQLQFESPPDPIVMRALSEPDFDPATGRLFASRKFLSDAVCGHAGEWQWQGNEFVLARFARQNHCGGSAPGDWPVLYRSEVAVP